MDTIWWTKITKASLFIDKIVDSLSNEQSVTLNMPRFVPWRNTLYETVKENIRSNGVQRTLEIIDSSTGSPGGFLLDNFCKREIREKYRIGKSHAEFLANLSDITLNSAIVWIKLSDTEDYTRWSKFVTEYHRYSPKDEPRAVFVLEACGVEAVASPILEKISFDSNISDYDKYTFCTLACSTTTTNSNIMRYMADLVSTICREDIELCALCINEGESFAKNPIECIEAICRENTRSDCSEFDISKMREDIDSLIWECQIKLLFPLIERYRAEFIKNHKRDIARNLPIENSFGEIIESPEDAEIGLLFSIASMGGIQMKTNDEMGTLRFYKDMRNLLAHMKTIDYDSVYRMLTSSH